MSRLYLANPCALFLPLHTVLRAQSAPGFPRALCSREGPRDFKPRAKQAARMRTHVSTRRPGQASDQQARAGTNNHHSWFDEGWSYSVAQPRTFVVMAPGVRRDDSGGAALLGI